MGLNTVSDGSQRTVEIPLSPSCNVSRTAVVDQDMKAASPIGSRHNDMSLLASEVETITHLPDKRQIVIKMRSAQHHNRVCLNPFVVGRLSGQYVTMISKWTRVMSYLNNTQVVDESVGEYNVPSTGEYWLEIIGILCNDLIWDEDYRNVCLEDPAYMQITDDFASVDATKADSTEGNRIGHWKWSSNESSIPLHTRYQPPGCRQETSEECQVPMSLDRFNPYQFQFPYHNETSRVKSRALNANATTDNPINLCFVGLSHAREMATAVNIWLQQWNTSNILAISYDCQFPRLLTENFIQSIIIGQQCNKTVVAAGQWSAGRKPPGGKYRNLPPTLFPEYFEEVQNMISTLQQSDAKNVFLRQIHYNSLGDVKLKCPPEDWRHPSVIDKFNSIIMNLTQSMGIPFIDTSHIIQPMWDSAGDYCHYRHDSVSRAEALYVLDRLLD